MILRTPRRRISPRTKRKYRIIKNFFRRALGTASQEYINNTNSSTEISVSDLKSKIDLLEQQLDRVSKHCQDLASLEKTISKQSENYIRDFPKEQDNLKEDSISPKQSIRHTNDDETKLFHHNSSKRSKDKNALISTKDKDVHGMILCTPSFSRDIGDVHQKYTRRRNSYKLNENFKEQERIERPTYHTIAPIHSGSSFRSLSVPVNRENIIRNYSNERRRKSHKKDYTIEEKEIRNRQHNKKYKKHESSKHKRREYAEVDEDFIADVINKQYKPVKLFGKRHSDFSQFSAPVCRDQEYRKRQEIEESSELCSCCYHENRHRYIRNSDLSDMRSICDTRLYSSKRHRSRHRKHIEDYNNENLYDVFPVKEKASPKSRRKFAEDTRMTYQCNEVPPSPRTHRPRLNLKVQNYTGFEDDRENYKQKYTRDSQVEKKMFNRYESDFSDETVSNKKLLRTPNTAQIHEEIETTDSLQSPEVNINQMNMFKDTTVNTQVSDSAADKTLSEIKDILQNFLLEIKKESLNDEKYDPSNKNNDKSIKEHQDGKKINMNELPYSGKHSNYMAHSSAPQFMPSFPNPCCYPVIPINVCPVNCIHNGCIVPNPSFTYAACAKKSKENICLGGECNNNKSKLSHEIVTSNETQELIKEIYKFVSQNPKSNRKADGSRIANNIDNTKNRHRTDEKQIPSNRSAGDSARTFRHDANVGTPNMKCLSKSCEAIGSKMPSAVYTTNTSYSDTVLEKLSLEVSESSTESDISSDTPVVKQKQSKFKKILQSLRLIKKKEDVIEACSESSEKNVKHKAPFQQRITNYAMYGQEYFHPPPLSKPPCCLAHPPAHSYDNNHGNAHHTYLPQLYNQPIHHSDPIYPNQCNTTRFPSPFCPGFDPRNSQIQNPQVPLCLKEIEVKSIGTQSVRKTTIFSKFTKKIQSSAQRDNVQQYASPPPVNKPTLWKSLQDKAKQPKTDPLTFSFQTQKKLAEDDMKLKNAMLKKLFYKRNPFSPRNLIVKTLLGKDKSSFGNPPKMYKPRMFL